MNRTPEDIKNQRKKMEDKKQEKINNKILRAQKRSNRLWLWLEYQYILININIQVRHRRNLYAFYSYVYCFADKTVKKLESQGFKVGYNELSCMSPAPFNLTVFWSFK